MLIKKTLGIQEVMGLCLDHEINRAFYQCEGDAWPVTNIFFMLKFALIQSFSSAGVVLKQVPF